VHVLVFYTLLNLKMHGETVKCVHVFCMDLTINGDYFPIQQKLTGFYNLD